jgi:type IV secretion system protein VirB9
VVGIWNEAFDPDGVPPAQGTTVNGVERDLRFNPTGSGSH